ncbi:peptidase M60 [Acrocarpospora corrugata]|uniref:Peptidase M60 n=1 Tax=Acrocarpospora corrugata TaxID=35763 RepID=A0A5M3W0Y6_9ACTN|nr:M60 family metallopeptidase [Acrocarpospora corrugata]GES01880.1 peptidase M60 [Acrocarpospora corrugata]
MSVDETQPHVDEVWAAWTDDRKLWVTARGGPGGANLQAQWPNGTWAGIGDFRADGTLTNPDVPSGYMWSQNVFRLRAHQYGQVSAARDISVRPPLVVTPLWTPEGKLQVSARGGHEGANLQAQWPNGSWASIGDFRADGTLTNPDVPPGYMWSQDILRLRVYKGGLTFPAQLEVRVRPPLTGVSAVRAPDGKLVVSARGGPAGANLQAQWPNGSWASIGDFRADGTLTNPDVPPGYMWDTTTVRLRIHQAGRTFDAVEATVDFPQPRILGIKPSVTAGDEEARLQHCLQYADYQPTGYYAPAGKEITITLYGNAPGMEALIGTQGLVDRKDPAQQSPSMRPTALKPGTNKITDPYGGIVHIRYTTATGTGDAAWMTLGGITQAIPYYVKGTTTAAQWSAMLAKTPAPEVEMVSDCVVIAALLPTALALKSADPGKTLAAHDEIIAIQEDISGLDGSSNIHARPRLRLYAVEANSTANPHATTGYIGLPHESTPGYFTKALLTEAARNSWVMLHEYGHHFQQETTYGGTEGISEISVNLYALAVGRKHRNEYSDEFPNRWAGTQAYLSRPRSQKRFEASEVDAQAIFEQLRLGLGDSFLRTWHKYVRAEHGNTTDTHERKKWFVVSASAAAQLDLCDFFADWGLLKESEQDIWATVRGLGLRKPEADMTKLKAYT